MQPAATTFAPVSAAASSVSIESCFAFSTKPQVLTRTTSAPSASVLTCQPPASRRAASSSESTSLRAQPRVSRATRRGAGFTDTPTRLPGAGCRAVARLVDPECRQGLFELVGLDQHLAGLGSLGGAHDATGLHEIHQPARLGEADPQLALQHRGGAELRRDDQLDGLDEQLQVVTDLLVDLLLLVLHRGQHVRPELGLALVLAELDDRADLLLVDPGALEAVRLGGAHRQEEAVAA